LKRAPPIGFDIGGDAAGDRGQHPGRADRGQTWRIRSKDAAELSSMEQSRLIAYNF
jgi:hypothetical protein